MMEDHDATLEDFEHNTKTWRVAVELSACEEYEYTPYKDLWEKIICTSFVERQEHNSTAQETAEKIREYLTSDGLVFNSEGRIEQGCGKEDCCQTELAL